MLIQPANQMLIHRQMPQLQWMAAHHFEINNEFVLAPKFTRRNRKCEARKISQEAKK